MRAHVNLVYATPGGIPLEMDLWVPDEPKPAPVVLMIHGGGWISGDRSMVRDEADWLSPQGFACACIDYRLAPLHPYPAAVQDVRAAIRFLRASAEQFGLDGAHLIALGHSAGGYLSAMAALSGAPDERTQGAVSICPITDLTEPRTQHQAIAWGFIEQFMGGVYEENPGVWAEASPIAHVAAGAPPMLLVHGVEDDVVPVAQSQTLVRKLREVGANVTYLELPGEAHAFRVPAWQCIREAYLGFLGQIGTDAMAVP